MISLNPAPYTSNHARSVRSLLRLAGASDEPETRQLLTQGAFIRLGVAKLSEGVRA